MYPNDVIVMKNDAKFRIAFLYVSSAQETLHLLDIALQLEIKYCFSSNVLSLQTICRKYFVNVRDLVVAMVTN